MKTSTFADRLALVLTTTKITAAALSRDLGISEAVISQYRSGKYVPKPARLAEFAQYFHVSEAWLMGYDVSPTPDVEQPAASPEDLSRYGLMPIRTKKYPLLGGIACGEPSFADEEHELYVLADADIGADYCLRAQGDSMIGARICDGDIVFIRRQDMVENGEIAAVLIGDETTLKRVHYDRKNNLLLLFAENPACRTQRYADEELEQVHILGRAVAFQSRIR